MHSFGLVLLYHPLQEQEMQWSGAWIYLRNSHAGLVLTVWLIQLEQLAREPLMSMWGCASFRSSRVPTYANGQFVVVFMSRCICFNLVHNSLTWWERRRAKGSWWRGSRNYGKSRDVVRLLYCPWEVTPQKKNTWTSINSTRNSQRM